MQAAATPPALRAEHVACRRGDRVLFAGVSFALAAGEALHVVGANGAGKSSLLRILAGLLPAFAGQVGRNGMVGLLDERTALEADVTLARALAFWRRLDRAGDRQPDAIARLGLAPLLDVPVRLLSTGQRRRAAIVRLIGQGAPIWLLDEPLNGLDADGATLATEIIAAHRRDGGLCVVASHQPLALGAGRSLRIEDFAPARAIA